MRQGWKNRHGGIKRNWKYEKQTQDDIPKGETYADDIIRNEWQA